MVIENRAVTGWSGIEHWVWYTISVLDSHFFTVAIVDTAPFTSTPHLTTQALPGSPVGALDWGHHG